MASWREVGGRYYCTDETQRKSTEEEGREEGSRKRKEGNSVPRRERRPMAVENRRWSYLAGALRLQGVKLGSRLGVGLGQEHHSPSGWG